MNEVAYERELTRAEVAQRKDDCFDLLTERDQLLDAISQHKREIKTLGISQASLDARISVLRHEIRSGKTLVVRQQELPLNVSVTPLGDRDGNPVSDPRGWQPASHPLSDEPRDGLETADTLVQKPNRWGEGERLVAVALLDLIHATRPKEYWPDLAYVGDWSQDVRDDVQRWCRLEHAHAHPIAGHALPALEQMPNVLSNIEARAPKKKRAKRGKG